MAIEQVFKPLQTRGRTGRQPDKKMETETERYLNSCKERIRGIDERAWKAARRHWNGIAKPLYGLGLLEDALVRIAGERKICPWKRRRWLSCVRITASLKREYPRAAMR